MLCVRLFVYAVLRVTRSRKEILSRLYSIRTGEVVLLCVTFISLHVPNYIFKMDPIIIYMYLCVTLSVNTYTLISYTTVCLADVYPKCNRSDRTLFLLQGPTRILLSNPVLYVSYCVYVYERVRGRVCELYMDVTCVYLKHATFN